MARAENFLFSTASELVLGPTLSHIQGVSGIFPLDQSDRGIYIHVVKKCMKDWRCTSTILLLRYMFCLCVFVAVTLKKTLISSVML
jgi:hypothetical protein